MVPTRISRSYGRNAATKTLITIGATMRPARPNTSMPPRSTAEEHDEREQRMGFSARAYDSRPDDVRGEQRDHEMTARRTAAAGATAPPPTTATPSSSQAAASCRASASAWCSRASSSRRRSRPRPSPRARSRCRSSPPRAAWARSARSDRARDPRARGPRAVARWRGGAVARRAATPWPSARAPRVLQRWIADPARAADHRGGPIISALE